MLDLTAGTGTGVGREREVDIKALERLHLDHERPLHATCHRWRAAMRAVPRSWDDGLWTQRGTVRVSEALGAACVRFSAVRRAMLRV